MAADLRFDLGPVATPGPVTLTFGEQSTLVSLVFDRPRVATPGPVALVFGELAPAGPRVDATISLSLPGLTVAVRAGPPNDATVVAVLPGLTVAVTGEQDLAVSRPMVGQSAVAHQAARPAPAGGVFAHQSARPAPAGATTSHTAAQPQRTQRTQYAAPHQAGAGRRAGGQSAHAGAVALRRASGVRHQAGVGTRRPLDAQHQEAQRRGARVFTRHQERLREPRPEHHGRHQEGRAWRRAHEAASGTGRASGARWRGRHQEAMRPPAGRWTGPVVPPFDPCYLPDPNLLFSALAPASTRLVFICERFAPPQPGATRVIPVRRVYMVANTLLLRRAADNAEVPTTSVSLSLDVDSWAWAFSATVPGVSVAQLVPQEGGPVELIAEVNGMSFRVLVEAVSRQRSFGRAEVSIRGRSRNAVLAAPYAAPRTHTNTEALTAQQLALEALTLSGVPLGWGLTWNLLDWLVPAGAWVCHGTPMDALRTIVEAAGAYVNPHPSAQTLVARHRYPEMPRDWAGVVPDIELPSAVVSLEGIEWRDRPAFNRVFVSGGPVGGKLGQVTLAGSAGELAAPMVVDPLLTDDLALRQRGRSILGDTGRQAHLRLRLPALPEVGLIEPGKFVRYVDGVSVRQGLVRSVEIAASHAQAWQTIGVETHE